MLLDSNAVKVNTSISVWHSITNLSSSSGSLKLLEALEYIPKSDPNSPTGQPASKEFLDIIKPLAHFYFDDLKIHAIYNSGCTDLLACNYDPIALVDDSSCNYHTILYDTIIANNSYNWQSIILTISGDYVDTLLNSVGCDSIIYLNLTITSPTGVLNIKNTKKSLLKITDVLGRETPYRRNTPLLYIYDDGTVEERIVIE